VYVDGQPAPGMVASQITAAEVEAVEIYGIRGDQTNTLLDRWPPGLPCGNTLLRGRNPASAGQPQTSAKFGLQRGGGVALGAATSSSTRSPADPFVKAIVIWLKR
jgi:hypothetical protein